ncbi:hypothetical protein L6452_43668 [Arctium lappa]|uniref:Uncharacterized protein n=1 Tax=Arctium lappa TaxID=4217 RepID=A0ACB8XEQ0_ARCLA|nr:hypothetical protein L6452_43668 [Arctium lappa]
MYITGGRKKTGRRLRKLMKGSKLEVLMCYTATMLMEKIMKIFRDVAIGCLKSEWKLSSSVELSHIVLVHYREVKVGLSLIFLLLALGIDRAAQKDKGRVVVVNVATVSRSAGGTLEWEIPKAFTSSNTTVITKLLDE